MNSSRFLILIVLSSAFWFGCSSAEKYDSSTPEGAYKNAESYEKDERYEEAIQKFQDVKNKHPYSRFATQAELKVADIQYKRESYVEAQAAYQLFKDFHPKHPQIDYVTFRLGMSYFMQLPSTIDRDISLTDKAVLYFDEVINSYPNSQYVAEAREKRDRAMHMQGEKELYIAGFYYKREMYDSALRRFETVLKNYPNLGFEPKALYGAAKSAFETGEKERGIQHAKNLSTLYPNSSEAKSARSDFRHYGIN